MFYSKKIKKIKKVSHCFFSRKNGFSKGIYEGLNCGRGSKDSKKNVRKNLEFVSKKMFSSSSIIDIFPLNRFRPSFIEFIRTLTVSPLNLLKSSIFVSGLSIPGELTSRL